MHEMIHVKHIKVMNKATITSSYDFDLNPSG